MNTKTLLPALLLTFAITACSIKPAAPVPPAVGLTSSWLTDPKFNKTAHLGGELQNHADEDFTAAAKGKLRFALLGKSADGGEVVHVADSEKDFYVFVRNGKIEAIRQLAMTGMIENIVRNWHKTDESVRKNSDIDIEKLKLTIARDDELVRYGQKHIKEFNAIYRHHSAGLNSEADSLAQKLHLNGNTAQQEFKDCSRCAADPFLLVIGGMLDNDVGYLYSGSTDNLPQMDRNGFIMLRQIAPNWYLYKRT
ncbi:hypothetical protein [Neisseria sp.]|uniref:hypothetical protein n=1 Tax=Neisseria sp. TaxID=192066 RepID=UPI00359F9A90